jgi:hypothetical protein
MSRILVSAALLAMLLTVNADAEPLSGGDYVIAKSTIDGGGGASAAGSIVLIGTIGQPDAGFQSTAGGENAIAGGFWAYVSDILRDLIFKDGFD